MHIIQKYEHEAILIGSQGFTRSHWQALIKLNEKHQNKYFDILHNGIKLKHYVGVIQVNNLLIEILPKTDKNSGNEPWKKVLLQMLKATGKLKVETSGNALVRRQNLNLLEIYFLTFLQETELLIRQGLIKQYRKNTANTKALKGKLDFAGNIRHNLLHKERFYTRHQVYDIDHLLHHILRLALKIVQDFSNGTSLKAYTNRLLLSFSELTHSKITPEILQKINFNRKSHHYKKAFELARLIILNYSPDITGGADKMMSILFDMNELWERYILKTLQKTVNNNQKFKHWEVIGQESKTFIGNRYLQPDIILRNKQTDEVYILDTKWKKRTGTPADISDLRQMYAYGRFWKATKLILLYPSGELKTGKFQLFKSDDFLANGKPVKHYCKTSCIPVMNKKGELARETGENILNLFNLSSTKEIQIT